MAGTINEGPWTAGAGEDRLFFASWARGERERGAYGDAELTECRRAAVATRRAGGKVWVVVHAGALPDWQVARGGWTDPDVLANWGCWIDRLGRSLLEAVDGYGREARRVGRVLLDAQAVARLELHRGSGAAPLPVGAVFPVPTGLRERWAARTWIEAATTGKLGIPWGIGELPNGTGALDVVGGAARGTRGSSWAGGARW